MNELSELENRTLVEIARAMIYSKNIPLRLWAEVISCAGHVLNRIPNRRDNRKTVWKKTKCLFPIFGTTAYVLVPPHQRDKRDATEKRVVFVGYRPSDTESVMVIEEELMW
jgi:hypothetical protein